MADDRRCVDPVARVFSVAQQRRIRWDLGRVATAFDVIFHKP